MVSRILCIVLVLILAVSAVLAGAAHSVLKAETIYPGVSLGGVDLGGLTVDKAEAKLTSLQQEVGNRQITLRYGTEQRNTSVANLGGTVDRRACAESAFMVGRQGTFVQRLIDVANSRRSGTELPVAYGFDRSKASSALQELARRIEHAPHSARLSVKDGALLITSEKPGIKMDIQASLAQIEETVNSGAGEVELVVATATPEVTAADLEGINGVLASYSTRYKPWERNRTHNLELACGSIDGILIKPGEVFSYNKIVGERVKERGFRDAPIFMNGEVESGVGGGICQVCTTAYNAVLLSNLKIVRRSHHSRPVAYAPVGRDATVAWPSVDFKFENNTDAPLYVSASVGKKTVDVKIFGRKQEGQTVQLVSSGHKVISAPIVKRTVSDAQSAKKVNNKGRSGHRVSTYRIVKSGDEVVKRELISNDYYRPETRVVAVIKEPAEPDEAEVIQAASPQ